MFNAVMIPYKSVIKHPLTKPDSRQSFMNPQVAASGNVRVEVQGMDVGPSEKTCQLKKH
jgi:hypothetical protein